MKNYDVIIAGASFAGLAVARALENAKVLLIDSYKIGEHQKSACGTPYFVPEQLGCEKAIMQRFTKTALHTAGKEILIKLQTPFCTFDYKKFCELMYKKTKANVDFLQATVKGAKNKGSVVVTDKGSFEGKIVVDCTGAPAVLASSLRKNYFNKKMTSFGIETELPYQDDVLRFFYYPKILESGAAWLFPVGEKARFGLGSYVGKTNILENLKKFLSLYKLKPGKIHGGYFCYCLRKPIVEKLFVVGCAAGQTLPLTGEGIRRSIYFGKECGKIAQKIFDKKISLAEGQKRYVELALSPSHVRMYNLLLGLQNRLIKSTEEEVYSYAKTLENPILANLIEKIYLNI